MLFFLILIFCHMQITSLEAETYPITESKDSRVEQILKAYIQSLELREEITPDQLSCESLLGGFSGTSICRFDMSNHSYVLRLFKSELGYYDSVRQIITGKLARYRCCSKGALYRSRYEGIYYGFYTWKNDQKSGPPAKR